MKIRIKGNSIRMRLSRSETTVLGQEGYLEERTEFGEGVAFIYAVARYHTHAVITADFTDNKITILIPASIVTQLVETDLDSASEDMPIGNGKNLHLIVEKAFRYTDEDAAEDQNGK